ARHFGLELLDVHAAHRERMRNVAHDAGMIISDELERERVVLRVLLDVALLDDDTKPLLFEPTERLRELIGARLVDADPQDACEFSREPRHAAFLPVAFRTGDDLREVLDDPRSVFSDDGEYQRDAHGTRMLSQSVPGCHARFVDFRENLIEGP